MSSVLIAAGLDSVLWLFVGLIPGGLVAAGVFVWSQRRHRALESQLQQRAASLRTAHARLDDEGPKLDDVTGLPSRQQVQQRLDQEWRRAAREGSALSMLVVGVDGQADDESVSSVARVLDLHLKRPADFVARYDDAVFLSILPSTDLGGAGSVAERLVRAVAAVGADDGRDLTITVVVGTDVPTLGGTPSHLERTATEAFQRARRHGRNRVVMPGPDA